MAVMRHRGKWELQDRFASVWQYLPVSVPAGASGLRAELEYDRAAATLDLGCIGPAGFRGWSGGARRSFAITPENVMSSRRSISSLKRSAAWRVV